MTTTPRLRKSLTQVNTTDAGSQLDGQVTSLSDGGYVVVWTDSNQTTIVGQRYDVSGNKVGGDPLHGGEFKISPFISIGNQFAPAIATLANGNVAVAFVYDDLFLGDNDIYVGILNSSLNPVPGRVVDAIAIGTSQVFDPTAQARNWAATLDDL